MSPVVSGYGGRLVTVRYSSAIDEELCGPPNNIFRSSRPPVPPDICPRFILPSQITISNRLIHRDGAYMERDWKLLEKLSRLGDGVLVNVKEAACVTGFAAISIQQRRVKNFPKPISTGPSLRWTLGQLRSWGAGEQHTTTAVSAIDSEVPPEQTAKSPAKRGGRPRLKANDSAVEQLLAPFRNSGKGER